MTYAEVRNNLENLICECDAANDCIVEILESYMTFVTIAERTIMNYAEMPDKIENMFKTLVSKTRNDWLPILNIAKKIQGTNND